VNGNGSGGPAGEVLVIGSLPPPDGGHRASLLDKLLSLEAAGRRTTVLALDTLSAAHHYLPGPGIAAALAVLVKARGRSEVVIQLEPGLPVRARAGRLERAASLTALAQAVRRVSDVTLRLDHLDDLPGGYGGRAAVALWQAASTIEAGSEEVRRALTAVVGEPEGKVVAVTPRAARPDEVDGWSGAEGMTAADVVTIVRRRAAGERARLAAAGRLAGAAASGRTRVPQWQWLPTPGAGVPDLGPAPLSPPVRDSGGKRVLRPVLAAAERHPATRLAARAGLSAYRRVRRAARLLG